MSLTQVTKAGLHTIALDHVFTIGASGSDHYTFQGEGLNGTVNDPTLYLTRGKTYRFENGTGAHPIRIQSTSGASGTAYNTGVTNNAGSGTVIVEVQHDAPDVLYYQCTSHAAMNGILYITGALADGGVTSAKIADGAIVNADINASAAIAGTKISPDFGSQAIATTGTASVGNSLSISGADPVIHLNDSNHNSDYSIYGNGGVFTISDATNTADRFEIQSDGTVDIAGNLDANGGLDVTGNITVTGTVDGVDVAALNTTVSNLSTDIVSDSSPQLGGDLDTNSHNILLDDDHQVKFGASNDLEIYHDSSSQINYIKSTNTSTPIQLQAPSGEIMLKAEPNGSIELFENGSKKFETIPNGVQINLTSSDNSGTPDSYLNLYNGNNGVSTMAGLRFAASTAANTDHWIYQKKHSSGNGTDLIVGHGSNERLRFIETGGFTFNGDTAAANALNGYEEGTYTPVVRGSGGWAAATSSASGIYIKIGKMVMVSIQYASSNMNSVGGNSFLRCDLPFSARTSGMPGTLMCSEWSLGTSNVSWLGGEINANDNKITFHYHNGNNNNTNLLYKGNIGSQLSFKGTAIYHTT